MTSYIALIRKDSLSEFRVAFPDFPSCVAAGSTLESARRQASEVLTLHIDGLYRTGDGLPEPVPLDSVMGEPENREAIAFLVPVQAGAMREVEVRVSLPEGVLERIDAFTQRHHTSRSAFLTRAALHAMRECGGPG